ncbi:hypothetical protein [Mameliella alba]|uniref:hypothetical protein n=1 Tax=Mameliella alba TaxID=561184 RepID=UPI000B52A76A|nr:hypothetical protein [Mameliella alba]OWV41800.1 hypothetical protein CDZ95_16935 [Mameliella alba]
MTYTPSQSPNTAGTQASLPFHDITPTTTYQATQPADKWTTPWHGQEDEQGILAEHGRVRVQLDPSQWMICVKREYQEKWEAVSFHRETGSLLRTLDERPRHKGAQHLAGDYEAVRSELVRILE